MCLLSTGLRMSILKNTDMALNGLSQKQPNQTFPHRARASIAARAIAIAAAAATSWHSRVVRPHQYGGGGGGGGDRGGHAMIVAAAVTRQRHWWPPLPPSCPSLSR